MISIKAYEPSFDPGIRALFRIPVSGNIRLALEREPDYYIGAKVQCEIPEVYVAFDEELDKVWAVFNIGKRRLWYDGQIHHVRYLCDLRIHPQMQQTTLFFRIIRHFKISTANEQLPAQTVVFGDNYKMIQMISKRSVSGRNSTVPFYHLAGNLVTSLLEFKTGKVRNDAYSIRRATESDISNMQRFFNEQTSSRDYFPYYEFSNLSSDYYKGLDISHFYLAFENDQLAGICGTWDQSEFKQTRITGYSTKYKIIRPFYNIWARLMNRQGLPMAGTCLSYQILHCIVVKENEKNIFRGLLGTIQKDLAHSGFDQVLCSMEANDPLRSVIRDAKPSRDIRGYYYYVNDGQQLPESFTKTNLYLEAARI